MPRALVTGGAGFIGSHLVDALLAEGWSVTCVDNFDPMYPRALKERNIRGHHGAPGWTHVAADIRDFAELDSMLEGLRWDAIVHLAARGGVRPSLTDPVGYMQSNVVGTQNVLELARRRETPQVVFCSSSSVYGINENVPWHEDDHVLQPISPYASTKVSGELACHVYAHLYGIRVLALRLFTVYGPRQRPDLAIAKFTEALLRGEPIPMYGDGSSERDYTFVADVVRGLRAAMTYDGSMFECINVGNSRTIALRDLVAAVGRSLGIEPRIELRPLQPGDVPRTWSDVSKAKRLLGYEPRVSLDEGLAEYARWVRSDQAV